MGGRLHATATTKLWLPSSRSAHAGKTTSCTCCAAYSTSRHTMTLASAVCIYQSHQQGGRRNLTQCTPFLLYAGSRSRPGPTANPTALDQRLAVQRQGLVIADLEGAVRFYYSQGLASTVHPSDIRRRHAPFLPLLRRI